MSYSLPDTGISKVMGLLEILHDRGDSEETVRLVSALKLSIEDLLPVTEAAEMLGFVSISGGRIKLSEIGLKIVNGDIQSRKSILKDRLVELESFKKATSLLADKKNRRMPKRAFLKLFKAELSPEDANKTVKKIIEWGRHAGIIGYESDSDQIYLVS